MNQRKSQGGPGRRRSYWLIGGAFTVVAAGLLSLVWARSRLPTPTGGDRAVTFDVPAHIGQPAPAFTAIGVDGQPYIVTPGDGRAKAIIFYMGFQ